MSDARLATGFPAHPKTKKLKKRLGPAGPWALVCLFLWCRESRPTGDLSGMSDEDIELAADWDGEDGALVSALAAVKFIDGEAGSYQVHDWAEHQPWSAGSDDRRQRAAWRALCKHHGRDGAAERMPEYAARIGVADAHDDENNDVADKQHAASLLVAEPSMLNCAARSAPSPSPSPSPSPRSKDSDLTVRADESADSPPSATSDDADAAKPKRAELPASPGPRMMDLWAEIMPDQHQPIDWPPHRSSAVSARWREKAAHYRWPTQDDGMAWFDRLFRYCRASEFLMGKKPPRDRSSRPFALTFDWLFAPKNFTKIIEGHFHEPAAKGSTGRPVRPAAGAGTSAAAN
jgi:hypothetical protein